ncbi:MAG: PLD nuclease N-terminal domain-containing protein [Microbacteriaceae bacterium]|nr:PLD nuclease N-terminal domain-containing protein [Microbacteriaceae bacterium]MDR9443983.1 PLD nuclease N-terminal domain-containing protein [Microbacteriaceae bacterium]
MARLLIVLAVVVVAFSVFTTVYAATADKTRVRALPKWAWVLLCLFIPIVGGGLYLWLGMPKKDGGQAGLGKGKPTVAPDDDPRFLRDMQRRMRDQNKKRRKKNDDDKK